MPVARAYSDHPTQLLSPQICNSRPPPPPLYPEAVGNHLAAEMLRANAAGIPKMALRVVAKEELPLEFAERCDNDAGATYVASIGPVRLQS